MSAGAPPAIRAVVLDIGGVLEYVDHAVLHTSTPTTIAEVEQLVAGPAQP